MACVLVYMSHENKEESAPCLQQPSKADRLPACLLSFSILRVQCNGQKIHVYFAGQWLGSVGAQNLLCLMRMFPFDVVYKLIS